MLVVRRFGNFSWNLARWLEKYKNKDRFLWSRWHNEHSVLAFVSKRRGRFSGRYYHRNRARTALGTGSPSFVGLSFKLAIDTRPELFLSPFLLYFFISFLSFSSSYPSSLCYFFFSFVSPRVCSPCSYCSSYYIRHRTIWMYRHKIFFEIKK